VASGEVTLAYLGGLGRDFAARYSLIYQGALAGTALDNFIVSELDNLRSALDTLSAAGNVRLVLENVLDFGVAPFVVDNWLNFLGLAPGEQPDPAKMQRVTDAVSAANVQIQDLADQRGIPVIDHFSFVNYVARDADPPPFFEGYRLDRSRPTEFLGAVFQVTDPLAMWLDTQHWTPAPNGLKANVVLDAVRQAYDADVPPLSDQEILAYAYSRAGMTPPSFTETSYFDVSGFVRFNHAPQAMNDAATTREQTPVTLAVLGNDVDPDGDPLTLVSFSTPANGAIVVNPDQSITYSPDPDFHGGTDTFTYTVSDGRHRTSTATVRVDVVRSVEIDIVTELVNVDSNGVLTVVIYGAADFNVNRVLANTVQFAGASVWESMLTDRNQDGQLDLMLKFRTQDTALRSIYEQLIADDVNGDGVLDSNHQTASVSLTGETTDHVFVEGFDELDLFLSGKALRTLLEQLAAAEAI
jgi:hypothetical protein